jgi:hypothetical protein
MSAQRISDKKIHSRRIQRIKESTATAHTEACDLIWISSPGNDRPGVAACEHCYRGLARNNLVCCRQWQISNRGLLGSG